MASCVLILPLLLAMVAGVRPPAERLDEGAPGVVSAGPGSRIHHLAAFSTDKLKAHCRVTANSTGNSTDQCSPGKLCYSDQDCASGPTSQMCPFCVKHSPTPPKPSDPGECQHHNTTNDACAHFAYHEFVHVMKATTQTVAGTTYVIDAETSAGTLHLKLFEQVWTASLEVTEASITTKPVAGLLGLPAALQLLSTNERVALGQAAFDAYLERQKRTEEARTH